MIFDELHLLNENNAVYEVVVSRMRQIQTFGKQPAKIPWAKL